MVVFIDNQLKHITPPIAPESDYDPTDDDNDDDDHIERHDFPTDSTRQEFQDQDAYAILGLDVHASNAEVQSAYRRLVKQYHPDRLSSSCYDKEKFYQITTAGQVLRDRYHRMLYDIQHQKRYVPESEIHDVISQLRRRAITIVANMTETVQARRLFEYQRDGLIIVKALYGDLKHRGALDRLPGGCIDVTVPIQCMVQSSELVDHSKTKMFLDGFYDPCPNEPDKQLFIRYIFQRVLHQICYSDSDEMRVPMRSHSVSRVDIKDEHLHSTSMTFPTRKVATDRLARQRRSIQKNRLRTLRFAGMALVFLVGLSTLVRCRWPYLKPDRRILNSK